MKRSRQPDFEALMQALAEDDKHRRLVAWICRQDDFQRRSLVRTQLDTLRLKGAPTELIVLMEALLDPAFAEKTARFLEQEKS